MRSDPNHIKEFKEIAESMVRMETKLDSALAILGDHEARLRVAEAAVIIHNDNKVEYDTMKADISTLKTSVSSISQTVSGWSRALWLVGGAGFSSLGLAIWEMIKNS